jgi:hypothetical protein
VENYLHAHCMTSGCGTNAWPRDSHTFSFYLNLTRKSQQLLCRNTEAGISTKLYN